MAVRFLQFLSLLTHISLAAVSFDGRCGPLYSGGTCINSGFGNCCSETSWCGSGDDYCNEGCQSAFGACALIPASKFSASNPIVQRPSSPALTVVDTRYPNYIIPVFSKFPGLANGTQFSGKILHVTDPPEDIYTEIVFDFVPSTSATCRLNFVISKTGPYAISGQIPWKFDIYNIADGFVDPHDSWNRRPRQGEKLADVIIWGDLSTSVTAHTINCKSKVQVLLRADQPLDLSWFELTNPQQGIVLELLK